MPHAAPPQPERSVDRPRPAHVGLARLIVAAAVAVILAVCAGFTWFSGKIDTAETSVVRHADGIVALTGGADRVSDAIALLLGGRADRLLITGVNPSTTGDDLIRRFPNARALVGCCVDLGYRAANTIGNAHETADWARMHGMRTLIVVTSNYHMPRALAEISYELPGADLQAYSVVSEKAKAEPWWADRQLTRIMVGEYLKFMIVKVRQTFLSAPHDGAAPRVADQRP